MRKLALTFMSLVSIASFANALEKPPRPTNCEKIGYPTSRSGAYAFCSELKEKKSSVSSTPMSDAAFCILSDLYEVNEKRKLLVVNTELDEATLAYEYGNLTNKAEDLSAALNSLTNADECKF